ncbi:hypothetical protein UA08_05120 [Talaromyces atroroseus]|uniref:PPM-type phosphatase domain-containing protein n=1 Tax=Talaromyces atroroseus TaxID=1441469 RepID=A0A225AE07_TALAT|nr:hypothetical protein UA08_05120 [Talaromyces atroroseus]OKL59452.1 hypothetical protein UA08_05120 [Talaromyces atroroseus]
MRFLPFFAHRSQRTASDRSYTSTSSDFTMDSFTTSLFSSPSCFQPNFSDIPQSPHSSVEIQGITEDLCPLNRQQLAILRPPHQFFSPPKHGDTPYAINSEDWYQENCDPVDQCKRSFYIALKSPEDIWDSVYGTTGVVYGIAKVFIALCRSFRVDLHTPTANILIGVENAEQELKNGSVVDFVFAIEDLYFSLYARLEVEIALLHFCSSFISRGRKPKHSTSPTLPDPNHVYTILNVCRDVLDDKSVCSAFDGRLVSYHKRLYVEEMNRRYIFEGTLPLDPTGYRAHVNERVKDPNSSAYRHWCQIYPELQHLSVDILAFLSEKYHPIYPCPVRKQNEFAFKTPNTNFLSNKFAAAWEENMICAHRLCSLAKIQGKAVGELRREEEAFNVIRYASEQKCICLDICSCSRICTRSGSTLCPCSGRWLRGVLTHQPESGDSIREKSTVMGELTYESLAALKRELPDDLVQRELLGGINIIREEMIKQRVNIYAAETGEINFTFCYERSRPCAPSVHHCMGMVVVYSPALHATRPTVIRLRGLGSQLQHRSAASKLHFVSSQLHGYHSARPGYGLRTPSPDNVETLSSKSPFYFETGYALRPKRSSRPFPPPFVSIPSSSFSDPLTTHFQSQDRRPQVGNELIRGLTNGDDAILASDLSLGVNDGVGAWATKPEGHAAVSLGRLWSRLIIHFWALECERQVSSASTPDTVGFLQNAYEETVAATKQWLGTTTSATALLHNVEQGSDVKPLLYVTNIGDCQIVVIRPRDRKVLFKSREQWHWFDCPYQLGTNSVDQPRNDAVLSVVELEEGDIVLAVSDGVTDNLWGHEILDNILESVEKWEAGDIGKYGAEREAEAPTCMVFAARRLLNAALTIAFDPFADSPYMEKAIDEGLTIEGGKMDDISVVIGQCKRRV